MSSTLSRRLVAVPVALALAATAGAGGAWANDQFTDTNDGSFFHDSIGNIVAGGCATGFNDDTFRADTNPTRGQFAFWVSNCGGRVSFDGATTTLSPGGFTPPEDRARVKIEAGAAGEGSGFVVVMTSWTAEPNIAAGASAGASPGPDIQFAGSTPCPCNVETGVVATFSTSPANPLFAESADSWYRDSGDLRRMSGSGMQVVRLPAGADVELEMAAEYNVIESGAGNIDVKLSLTAFYVPFGWDGGQQIVPPPPP